MKIAAEIEWRKDCWGKDAQALYLGALCAGWISQHEKAHEYPWRGWFMENDEGESTGWFKTAEEARSSVESKLFDAIKIQPDAALPVTRDMEASNG